MRPLLLISGLLLAGLSGCGPTYSPDTYSSSAVQQANKVEQGVIVGVRDVAVTASGSVGTVTGAAAGGIAGAQVGVGPTSAFASLGGALVGGIAGSTVEHVTSDTRAFEYIVRKGNAELVSVTQKDSTPLALGQHVLVIAGNQARVVPDYTVPPDVTQTKTAKAGETAKATDPATKPAEATADAKPAVASSTDAKAAVASSTDAKTATTPSSDAKPSDTPPADASPAKTDAPPAAPADAAKPVEVAKPAT